MKIRNKTGFLAEFADFANFVIRESAVANSTYYKTIFSFRSSKSDVHRFKQKKTHTFTTTTPVKTSDRVSNQTKYEGSKEDKEGHKVLQSVAIVVVNDTN